jgi:hypothetical protein
MALDPKKEVAKVLLSNLKELDENRIPWVSIWEQISEHFNIMREEMYYTGGINGNNNIDVGRKQGIKLYDGTPLSALNIFTDGFYGAMISRAITWFILKLPQKFNFLEDIPEVRVWMQDAQSGIYSAFNNSNFYSEMRSFIRDGASIGTATLTIEDDFANNRLAFRTRHPREGYIAENSIGVVDTYYREYPLTARQASQEFSGSEELFSPSLKQAIRDKPNTTFSFLHAIEPRKDFDDRKISSVNKRVASYHMELRGQRLNSEGEQVVLRESGFDMFPAIVWRYFQNSPEVYGRSPCGFALVDAGNLQQMSKSLTRAGEIAADPAYNVPSEMQGRVRINAHGMNYYGIDPNRLIKPVTTGVNYPIGLDREDKKREMIEKHLNVDTFLLLQQAPRQMTAEEVREKITEKATLLSPMVGNFTSALDQIIDFVFIKELKAGRISPVPDILIDAMGGERIDTEFLGILAQAQKRQFEKNAITEGLNSLALVGEVYPNALDLVNPDKTGQALLKASNFPQTAMNSPEEINQLREQRALQAQEESKKLDMERMGAVMKDLSQAKKNSGGSLVELAEEVEV